MLNLSDIDPDLLTGEKPLPPQKGNGMQPATKNIKPEAPGKNGVVRFSSLGDCEPFRITKEKNIAHPEPTITINGAAVAAPGNITGISAASKAGKTAVGGMILAGAISKTGQADIPEGIKVEPNINGFAVIHADTEQSEPDHQDAHIATLKRAGLEDTPDYYLAYNKRELRLEEYQPFMNCICEGAIEKFGGIHLIVIDGGADYIADVNIAEEANGIVRYFIHLSIKYNCPVVIIIHQNPGSDKERGHFGSELQRKCYGLLTITKEGDISTLQAKIMRKAGNGEIMPISFMYDKVLGYHCQVDQPDKETVKDAKNMARVKMVCEKVFAPPKAFSFTESIARIMQEMNKSKATARRILEDGEGMGYITKGVDKNYRLVHAQPGGQKDEN